jgi:hypothetical protein
MVEAQEMNQLLPFTDRTPELVATADGRARFLSPL